MTRTMVEITFAEALRQAGRIEACADDMLRVSGTNLPEICAEIGDAWQGDSAGAYLSKVEISAGNITATANRLYEIAQTLRTVARIFRDSELAAIELAERRDY